MQAIARVNRVFNDKPGGLIVDYVPVTEPEKAFYDALICNQSAVDMLSNEKAKELVQRVKKSTTTDWTMRQSAKDRVKFE